MGNGVSTDQGDQGNLPTHGKRDVRQAADTEQHDWSELAEASITSTSLCQTEILTVLLVISSCRRAKLISPVSARMGDCLQAGKLSGYATSHPGRLSLLPSVRW